MDHQHYIPKATKPDSTFALPERSFWHANWFTWGFSWPCGFNIHLCEGIAFPSDLSVKQESIKPHGTQLQELNSQQPSFPFWLGPKLGAKANLVEKEIPPIGQIYHSSLKRLKVSESCCIFYKLSPWILDVTWIPVSHRPFIPRVCHFGPSPHFGRRSWLMIKTNERWRSGL